MNDIDRILTLPVKQPVNLRQAAERLYTVYDLRRTGKVSLRDVQVEALLQLETAEGLFGAIGVGFGKTLIAALAPRVLGFDKGLLLVPAAVRPRTLEMLAAYAEDWNLPDLCVLPYSRLSEETGYAALAQRAPEVIVADEAHMLKHLDAGRTKRVLRWFREHPETRFVALSGTMMSKSILHAWHLAELALRENTPFPMDRYRRESWARVLDVPERQDEDPADESDYAGLGPLRQWAREWSGTWFSHTSGSPRQESRSAFRARLRGSVGVVVTSEARVGCSLRLERLDLSNEPTIRQANDFLKARTYDRHDGVVFESPADRWRYHSQVALGFAYRLKWPDDKPDYEWLDARNRWAREAFYALQELEPQGIDTPLQLVNAIEAGKVGGEAAFCWRTWRGVRDRVRPMNEVDWLFPAILPRVLDLAVKLVDDEPMLVWYASDAVEQRLRTMGYDVYGTGETPPETPRRKVTAVCRHCHHQGYNLQRGWALNLVLEPSSSAENWEQMIGRTHRVGQPADEVRVIIAHWSDVHRAAIKRAKEGARYVEETQGMQQRLCYGDWI